MKTRSLEAVKLIIADRYFAVLVGIMLLIAVVYCIWVGVTVQPTELQVVNHYTAFGITNFYRNQWYYLHSIIAFCLLVAAAHLLLANKLYEIKNRTFALGFIWLGIVVLLISVVWTQSILEVASLS